MVWRLISTAWKMCRILFFYSLTPVRLPLFACLGTSLFHQSIHFNEKKPQNIAVISLRRLKARDGTWLQKSRSLGMSSNGKQWEQYRKVRCYWRLREGNRAAQPWKPPHQRLSSDGRCRTSEELQNYPTCTSFLSLLPSDFLFCLEVNLHHWAGEEELSINMPLWTPEIGFWSSCQ